MTEAWMFFLFEGIESSNVCTRHSFDIDGSHNIISCYLIIINVNQEAEVVDIRFGPEL